VTIIRAPAGYGKTTLLVDLCHEAPGDVCWFSLDEWDRDPSLFMQYLRLSLGAVRPQEVSRRSRLKPLDPRSALAEVAGLVENQQSETWLVLDDLHCIEGSRDVTELVDYFARRLPVNCRLFLSSRTSPSLPSLPRLRLTKGVIELDSQQLAFTREEVKEHWLRSDRGAISEEQIDRVLVATQGWPAAVALSGGAAVLEDSTTAAAPYLSDYLSAEVFNRLSADHRSFLVKASVLEALETDACADLLEMSRRDAEEILDNLPKLNIPLMPLGGARLTYRIHPILRDFLLANLKREDSELYRRSQRRAGLWCSARGRIREAVWHLGEGEEWDAVVQIVLEEAPEAYSLGQWHTLMSWLDLIPVEELRRHPKLRLWEARILGRLGQTDQALRVITDILAVQPMPEALRAEFEASRAASLRLKGEVRAALESARRSNDLAIRGNAPIEVITEARKELGLALIAVGSFSEAIEELRFALDIATQRGDTEASASLNGCLGSALGSAGRLAESASHLEQARQRWSQVGNAKELSWVLNNLAMAYGNMGHDQLARELFTECIAKARESGNGRAEAYALDSLADIDRMSGLFAESATKYREVLALSADLGEMTLSSLALTGLAEAECQLGHLLQAETLAKQALAGAEERGGEYEQALAYVALGRIARVRGNPRDAVVSFNTAVGLFEKAGATKELIESLLLLADALLPIRSSRLLLRATLERLPSLVETLRYDSFLVNQVSQMPAVIQYAIARRINPQFYRELLRKTSLPPTIEGPLHDGGDTASMPRVEVATFGHVEVSVDGRRISNTEWESEKSRELFLLMLTASRPLRRDEIIGALWPDHGGARSISAFHSTLHRIRRALYLESIVESGGQYQLNPIGRFDSDVAQFRALATKLRTVSSEPQEYERLLVQTVTLYTGPFAPALDSEWADDLRRQLEARFLETAATLANRLFGEGDFLAAISIYERILSCDPLNEPACYRALKCHLALGNSEAAATIYQRFRSLLEAELGQEPSPAIKALNEEMLRVATAQSKPP